MKRTTIEAAGIERVFGEQQTAERYEKHINRYCEMLRKRFLGVLKERGISTGTFLDAGCGAGQLASGLAKDLPGIRMTGVDLGDAILSLAATRAELDGVSDRVAFQTADVEALPFPDDSFDVVMNTSMLHMVHDPVRMLNELERVLKPNGLLLLTNIKRLWLMSLFMKAFKTTFTWPEAEGIIMKSNLRPWSVRNGLIDFTLVSDPI
jgi:ubiquinone/menaquinone biosynthesis C-methylase UbiE